MKFVLTVSYNIIKETLLQRPHSQPNNDKILKIFPFENEVAFKPKRVTVALYRII